MTVTVFGVIVLLIGTLLLFVSSTQATLAFVMLASLFGGSAALTLPALGGSSILPANLALLFLLLRTIMPGLGNMDHLGRAIGQNMFLIGFGLYGAITAYILPVLFARTIEVTPLHPGAIRQLFESAPLHFSPQNITTSIYLLGTTFAGLGSAIAVARPGSERLIAKTGIAVAILHASFGFIGVAVADTPLNAVVEMFRNGNYAQLDQSIAGFNRMAGVWPETSGFAAFAGAWMVFCCELWLRDIYPRWSALAASLLFVALVFATSSTGYVMLAGYAIVLAARATLAPMSIPGRKLFAGFFALVLAGIVVMAASMVLWEPMAALIKVLRIMTVDKPEGLSGQQRFFWAYQGFEAFAVSGGLGIGAGSFRSSSLITAILGSMGVIGIACFAAHLFRVFKPFRRTTWVVADLSDREAIGAAAGWASLMMLLPQSVASPSADPGLTWAILSGTALGLRAVPALAGGLAGQRRVSGQSLAGSRA